MNESVSRPLFEVTPAGLHCPPGDFHVDPWQPVARAVVTHAHADHARPGSGHYVLAEEGAGLARLRLGPEASIEPLPYGRTLDCNGVNVSLHPAGHVLGSAQVRIEHRGEVWVISGDYKLEPDPTCASFEPVRCHTFVTESTFGLPIYRWERQNEVLEEIRHWWASNQQQGLCSLLFVYSLGKAQRVLAGLRDAPGPIFCHGAIERLNTCYREAGVELAGTGHATRAGLKQDWTRALVLAPPSANGTPWMRRFGPLSTGFASGWMLVRGTRRRRSVDRGFPLSDHADWPGLNEAIGASGAERVWVTHGYTFAMARWLGEQGLEAEAVQTGFEGERDDGEAL